MKRYRMYIAHGYARCPDEEFICEFPDSATEEEIEKECSDTLMTLFTNLDQGWYSLDDQEEELP